MSQLKTKLFSSYKGSIVEKPNLLAIQTDSYKWFIREGLKELCDEISPIKDYAGKDLELKTLKGILDDMGVTPEEFRRLLHE